MAPVYVKGGVWTNVEDEILKAAVSKYGLNQWSRVASLLTKKSAKQAKARWNEWLNPNIDKSEWSREEDEKLLSLAKLLPNQWRTIAPIVGRTATHCVERYQKLLDDAANDGGLDDKEATEFGLSGPGIESLPATGASGVGELNINPESKPAKPDEEEMDDEEREMLSEARARLANTSGKKAKRKARERMLEESKRIALLQKRRELKAAGINVGLESKNKKNRKEFDYNADIPHEHKPQAGLYDVSEEQQKNQYEKIDFSRRIAKDGMSMQEVDAKHKKEKEKKQKETESEAKKHKLGLESAIEVLNEHERNNLKKRKLELPEPEPEITEALVNDKVEESKGSVVLKGIFDTLQNHITEEEDDEADRDKRIMKKAKELIASQATPSTLLVYDDSILPSQESTKKDASKKKHAKADLKKSISVILKSKFASLPKPRNNSGLILPSYDPNEETIKLEVENDVPEDDLKVDQGERLRNLQILQQIEEQKAKARRSRAVQRELNIPNPQKLRKPESKDLSAVDLMVLKEYQSLVKSDYRKYVDPTYQAPLVEDLEEDVYNSVNAEVEKEMERGDISKLHTITQVNFELPESFEIAEQIIERLHEMQKASLAAEEKFQDLTSYDEYKAQETKLNEEIYGEYANLYNANQELTTVESMLQEESVVIETKSKRLHDLVDRLVQAEHSIQEHVRSLRLKTLDNV
ncbi:uncharacterized protein RJT20DRAFT_124367 [Scheffersomyces xylosifermentans]|uniref:uncharacterized protein n=1 Tax=Scheffersomyces xylosifermentans TaxID=1304137 RepID=UPI00315D3811